MKKSIKFFAALAICATAVSCNKAGVETPSSNMKQITFSAGIVDDEDAKASLNGLVVEWTGDEAVNLWYKDKEGNVCKTATTMKSHEGKNATFSAKIPADAPADEFYIEMNAVADASGKAPFGTGNTRARVKTTGSQQAVAGSFDPSQLALGGRWTGTSGDNPSFNIRLLVDLLKITVNNNTGATLDKIVLESTGNLAGMCYWGITSYLSIAGSGEWTKAITLNGPIAEGTNDYYFVISVKNNNTDNKIPDMTITFHQGDKVCSKTNPTALAPDYGKIYPVGSFTLNSDDMKEPDTSLVPFGTKWGTSFLDAWKVAGLVTNTPFTGQNLTIVDSKSDFSIGNGNQYVLKSPLAFSFKTKDSGNGVLSFTVYWGNSNHTITVYVNDKAKWSKTSNPNESGYDDKAYNNYRYDVPLTVVKGDQIKFDYPNGSNNTRLYFYRSGDTDGGNITWKKAETKAAASLSSSADLSSDTSNSSYFNEL